MALAGTAALASHAHPATDAIITTYVTFTVAGQLFGIPVLQVQDILVPGQIAPIPLAPPEVRGAINLRGRIVTVIDMRIRLGLTGAPGSPDGKGDSQGRGMGVTVENGRDLYTLLVDDVGDVIELPAHLREPNPSTLDRLWLEFADGVFPLDDRLMVVLDIGRLLRTARSA
jgi:purine-binding chemotaxis protein CheW